MVGASRSSSDRVSRVRIGDSGRLPDVTAVLLSEESAAALPAHGKTEAAVLIPVSGWREGPRPRIHLTERRSDLRRHAGEISFPGGRRDPTDRTLTETALREAEEEVALPPDRVELAGALPPVGTFVTSYRVQPFVGLIPSDQLLRPDPSEVAAVLSFEIDDLASAYEVRRLVRRGIPFKTPVFEVGRHLIWGATARILSDLLRRLELIEPDK